jgi:hypothetical protein
VHSLREFYWTSRAVFLLRSYAPGGVYWTSRADVPRVKQPFASWLLRRRGVGCRTQNAGLKPHLPPRKLMKVLWLCHATRPTLDYSLRSRDSIRRVRTSRWKLYWTKFSHPAPRGGGAVSRDLARLRKLSGGEGGGRGEIAYAYVRAKCFKIYNGKPKSSEETQTPLFTSGLVPTRVRT